MGRAVGAAVATASVLVVEAHPIVRYGLARVIAAEPDLRVCGSPATHAEVAAAMEHTRPDLVILDLSFGQARGLALLTRLTRTHHALPVLVLSAHDELYYADRAFRKGARGYVMKSAPTAEIVAAMRQVLSGGVYVSKTLAAVLEDAAVRLEIAESGSLVRRLTRREDQVLRLIGAGLGTRQIAERVGVSVKTIENYRESLKSKLRLLNTPQLIRYAIQCELDRG